MKNSSSRPKANLVRYSASSSQSHPALRSQDWGNSLTTITLPKPQNNNQVLPTSEYQSSQPLISMVLPDPYQYLAQSIKSTSTQSQQREKVTPEFSFPILEMILNQPVNEDVMDNVGSLNKELPENFNGLQQSQHRGVGSEFILRNEISKYAPLFSEKKVYDISYRLAHKFTYKFKTIRLEFEMPVSVDRFKKALFEKVFRSRKVIKEVFIEKERDLVPLIDIQQLFTSRINFIQIRSAFKRFGVIEKPVLMKKKIRPNIGITALSNRATSICSTLSNSLKITIVRDTDE